MATLFISDLHLTEQRPAVTRLFLDFLATDAAGAEALYILGDLFEYWIGDEAASLPSVQPIMQALRSLVDSGVPVYVIHGNRDLLLGKGFEQASHCQLLDDPTVIDLYGEPTLISHGDYLCTDDEEYQKFRVMVRDPDFQARFLARDIEEREAIIQTYREISMANSLEKSMEIMDVNSDAVAEQMQAHDVQRMIHGHTHRPDIHQLTINGKPAQRIVLGDWYDQGSVLRCDAEGCLLHGIPIKSSH
ncbi:MAG: UDP-2,3-diacylglucosamine hydrolase [Acidithiobacillales bacterium SG8_45]|jgi:UDP-2,3-diacylglucosamine hydrolase|nr:MAG: UDP-2,3-diacylglucosamine hydrolase [Acidithiobacillales bacterium SG8_45]